MSRVVDSPGTKGPPHIFPSSFALPPNTWFLICAWCRHHRRPRAPCHHRHRRRRLEPRRTSPTSPSAADLTPPPRAPPRPPAHPAVACARPHRTCATRRPGPATAAPSHCRRPAPPPGAAALTLMCLEISLEISLNMDYLFIFENMDYLFRNYVVKYRLFVNLFNFDDK